MDKEFGKVRSFIWPIHSEELKKVIPMLLIFFLISFNYNVLRTLKDTLVVTAKSSGAEVIPFIKVWFMLPATLMMISLFSYLSSKHSREKVFYIIVSGFILYFALFVTVLYPNKEAIHPNVLADTFQAVLPQGLKGLISMFRYWTFSSFYVMSELWGTIVLFVLFWGFANQITSLHEAKRFYAIFGVGANFSGIIAGQVSVMLASEVYNPKIPFGHEAWEQTLDALILLVVVAGIASLALFRYLHTSILNNPRFYNPTEAQEDKKPKKNTSILQGLKFLWNDHYQIWIAIIVFSYNLVIALVEVVWKDQVCELYSSPGAFNLYTNEVTTLIGVVATLTSLFVSGNVIRNRGWTFTAMIAPLIFLVTSFGFFFFLFLKPTLNEWAISTLGVSSLTVVVFFGSLQNVLSRSAKYTVYDATKEMAFVPLPTEEKNRGKMAIDGVCTRLGKSGGALAQQGLFVLFETLSNCIPYIASLLFTTLFSWLFATHILGKKFHILTNEQDGVKKSTKKELVTI